jgi:hypothetical protein
MSPDSCRVIILDDSLGMRMNPLMTSGMDKPEIWESERGGERKRVGEKEREWEREKKRVKGVEREGEREREGGTRQS